MKCGKKVLAVFCVVTILIQIFASGGVSLAADTTIQETNGNGGKTDVGIWYVTYNSEDYWKNNFGDPDNPSINYRSLVSENPVTYGIPDSGDPEVIDFHLSKMAEAKIDFLVFDLTNGGLTDEMTYGSTTAKWIVENAKLTCERIAIWNETHDWKIRYAVAIGAYAEIRVKDDGYYSVREIIEMQAKAVYNDFFLAYGEGDNYYMTDGKPLLLCHSWAANVLTESSGSYFLGNYSSSYNSDGGDKTQGNKFTLRPSQAGQAGTYGWHMSASDGVESTQVHEEVELVIPGWGDQAGTSSISREGGAFYQENWDVVLENASPRIVMIAAFNDYNEKMAVFPTYTAACEGGEEQWVDENGNQDPYMYWDMTVDNIQKLRNKNGDTALPEDDLTEDTFQENINVFANASCETAAGIVDGEHENGNTIAMTDDSTSYFEIELEQQVGINKVVLYSDDGSSDESIGFADNIAIDIQLKNGAWKRVAETHNVNGNLDEDAGDTILPEDDLDGDTTRIYTFTFESVVAYKVRITGNNAIQGKSKWLMLEAEGYYDSSITGDYTGVERETTTNINYNIPYITDTNVLLNATVTSRNLNQYYPNNGYFLKYATDGNGADGVHTNDAIINYQSNGIASYELWLSMSTEINQIKICHSSVHETQKLPRHIAVDVQLADGTWQRVVEQYDLAIGGEEGFSSQLNYNFSAVETQRVRISASQSGNTAATNWRVTEIEGYFDPERVADDNVIEQPDDTNKIPIVEVYAGEGDVNTDGEINSKDCKAMREFLIGIVSNRNIAGDQYQDDWIDSKDLVRAKKAVAPYQ